MVVTGSHNCLIGWQVLQTTYGGDRKPQCLIGWQVLQTTYGGDGKTQCLIGWQVLQTTYGGDRKAYEPWCPDISSINKNCIQYCILHVWWYSTFARNETVVYHHMSLA